MAKKSTKTASAPVRSIVRLPVDVVHECDGFNARGTGWADDPRFAELVGSVAEKGVLQPVIVRKGGDGEGYLIVAGHRRALAARRAGLPEIPCVVLGEDEAGDADVISLIENLLRVDLDPVSECRGVASSLEGLTLVELARKTGKSVAWLSKRARVAKALAGGGVSEDTLRERGVDATYESIPKASKKKTKVEAPKVETEGEGEGEDTAEAEGEGESEGEGEGEAPRWGVMTREEALLMIRDLPPGSRVKVTLA